MGNPSSREQQREPEQLGSAEYVNMGQPVNFFKNKDAMFDAIKEVNSLPKDMHYSDDGFVRPEVKSLIGRFHPVHRLRLDIFKQVLQTGSLQSKHFRDMIDSDPRGVLCTQIRNDLSIKALMLRHLHQEAGASYIFDWLCATAIVQMEEIAGNLDRAQMRELTKEAERLKELMYLKHGWSGIVFQASENREALMATTGAIAVAGTVATVGVLGPAAAASEAAVIAGLATLGLAPLALALIGTVLEARARLPGGAALALLQPHWDDKEAMEQWAARLRDAASGTTISEYQKALLEAVDAQLVAQVETAKKVKTLIRLLEERAANHASNIAAWVSFKQTTSVAVGYHKDLEIRTNEQVFSILGPHTGLYYGDICIVLKQSIMYEPGFDISPCAGTGFLSGNAKQLNTWLHAGKYHGVVARDQFQMARLNAGVLGWRSVMSGAVAHAVSQRLKQNGQPKSLADITETDILEFIGREDSHLAIEAHLPGIVSLSHYVQRIVIPQSEFDKLTLEEQQRLEELVGAEKVMKVDGRVSPDIIMSHCLDGLSEMKEEGFRVFVSPEVFPADGVRLLRAVQPRLSDRADLHLKVSGSCQLLLGPGDAQGLGVTFGFGKIPLTCTQSISPDLVGHEGFVVLSHQALENAEVIFDRALPIISSGSEDSLAGPVLCWVASTWFTEPQLRTFELLRDDDGFVRLSARIGEELLVLDDVSKTIVLRTAAPLGQLCLRHVAVKAVHTQSEIRDLKIR